MKDEFDFDDDGDPGEQQDEQQGPPAKESPARRPVASSKDTSPACSSLSSDSRSRTSTTTYSKSTGSSAASSLEASESQKSASTSGNASNFQPRTRTARLKANGINKSPNRKVRFELASSSVRSDASSSSAATIPSANQSYRSFAERPTQMKKIRNKSLKRPWSLKEDSNDDATDTAKREAEEVATDPIVRTSSVDMYAIQDTVKVQRLADELRYCCDTLRGSRKTPRQLEAAADLSLMLSNRKTRWSLLFSPHHQQNNGAEDAPPLTIILNLMKWAKEKMGCSVVVSVPSQGDGTTGRTKTSRRAQGEKGSPRTPIVQEGLSPLAVEAMGIIWHFLSIDCTMANDLSSASARKLREDLLSSRYAIQGLLEMVVKDPYLNSLIGKALPDCPSSVDSLSQGSGSSISTSVPDSPLSTGSYDPTVEGRWRKRRRKLFASASTLDIISETGIQVNSSSNGKAEDFWSYTSETAGVKSRDNDSVSSTASQAADSETQFKQVVDKVKDSIGDLGITEHSCGVGKNEILARLPLLSMCRIVSGKFEGNEKSCIDDDMEENPLDDDDDELSRNPLLRTNAMLAEGGAIPFVARATSNAAVAIVHYLKKGKSCDGCEAYLRWKFCTLSSLVDDACLLTDANRSEFSTEGFASETGGYLLINVATVLKSLLETKKLLEEDGWGDVATAALRSLTSLTHDNEMAARDLQGSAIRWNGIRLCNSLSVIVDVLYEASKSDGDMTIFCLNTLANTLESGGTWEPFAVLTVGEDKESFLKWLTQYVVAQTESFQDALIETSFGSSQDRHSERQLDKGENEALMMAGNAFIFLAYILVRASSKSPSNIEEDVLGHLPGEQRATKVLFIKNTLKAFCNLYHFSVGALSLAIVAPVKKLLTDLEVVYSE